MSLSATLANALSGLNVAQQALSVTANNVANANTPGYSRKVLNQEAVVLGNRGAGVRSTEIARITDEFLIEEIRRQSSVAGRSETVRTLPGPAAARVRRARRQPRPRGPDRRAAGRARRARRQSRDLGRRGLQCSSAIDQLAGALGGLADQVQALRGEADQEIGRTVAAINAELAGDRRAQRRDPAPRASRPGQRRAARPARRAGPEPGREDRRPDLRPGQRHARDLHRRRRGPARLDAPGPGLRAGEPGRRRTPSFDRDRDLPREPARSRDRPAARPERRRRAGLAAACARRSTPSSRTTRSPMPTSRSPAGSRAARLAGLLEIRDRTLPALDDQLQELAAGLRFALNAAHNDASPVPPPAELSGSRTDLSDFAAATRSGSATFAVIDDRRQHAARLPDRPRRGRRRDRARRPDRRRARRPRQRRDRRRRQSRDHARRQRPGPRDRRGRQRITITDAAGRERDYGLAHYFGLNDLLVDDGARPSDFAVRADIAADPALLATARLDVGPARRWCAWAAPATTAAPRRWPTRSPPQPVIARGGLPAARSRSRPTPATSSRAARCWPRAPSRRPIATARWPTSSSTAPRRSRASTSTRRWPAWCSCSRPTRPPPG